MTPLAVRQVLFAWRNCPETLPGERSSMTSRVRRSVVFAGIVAGMACGVFENSARAQSGGQAERAIAKIDPCKLVTKDEIQAAIEAKRKPSELARLRARGIVWSISTTSTTEGESRRCRIHWQGNFGTVMQETGDLSITVYPAEYFNANVADMNRVRKRTAGPICRQSPVSAMRRTTSAIAKRAIRRHALAPSASNPSRASTCSTRRSAAFREAEA